MLIALLNKHVYIQFLERNSLPKAIQQIKKAIVTELYIEYEKEYKKKLPIEEWFKS